MKCGIMSKTPKEDFSMSKRFIHYALLGVLMCLALVACQGDAGKEPEESAPPVTLIADSAGDYRVVYHKTSNSSRGDAYEIMWQIKTATSAELEVSVDTDVEESTAEILIGETNRQLSQDLIAAALETCAEDSDIWAFAYRDGQLAFYFNTGDAYRKGMLQLKKEYLSDGTLTVPENLWSICEYTAAERAAEEESKALADAEAAALKEIENMEKRKENLEKALKNVTFTDADFGATDDWMEKYSMPTDVYTPGAEITQQHPRVFVTSDIVPKIRALLEDEEYANLAKAFWELADSENYTYGVFPEGTHGDGEKCRYSVTVLAQIEARAMAYLVTGNEVYGYEAILGIKNAMLTLLYTVEDHMDVYHGPSHTMFILAEVYDWCYDLLTEQDKKQMISGCVYLLIEADHFTDDDFNLDQNKPSLKATLNANKADYGLEFNFPPNNMSAFAGHGTGPQFLRDYMMVTVAFADEMPSWWSYVGGRYYEEFLPVTLKAYENGYVTQGTSCYAPIKLIMNLYPAYLLQTATGENPCDEAFADCADFMLSHLMPNGKMFETGDGSRTGSGASVSGYSYFYLLAALYQDTFSLQAAKSISADYTKFEKDSIYTVGPALVAALCATCEDAEGVYPDDLPLYTYTAYPAGQTTARDSWQDDAAVAFMKIGELTMGNHDLMDSGTFQLYYKGMLATTAGSYKWYGSLHHKYYLQGTISANSLLVYNPSMKKGEDHWYSGSQTAVGSPSTMSEWLSGAYDKGVVTGVENVAGEYSYLAGDITKSYHADTVDYVGRRMLSVFSDDDSIPMMFFVYDSITSDDANYKKTFLLHTVKEPTLEGAAADAVTVTPDANGRMTASVENGEGKLVLQNVYGGDHLHKIGGSGYAYWIGNENEFDGTANSGFNALDSYATDDASDVIWGRLEVTANGEKQTDMLNVMYVTDAGTVEIVPATLVEDAEQTLVGATIGDVSAMFVRSATRNSMPVSFTVSGEGTMHYYVSGLYAGTWTVTVAGKSEKMTVSEEGGFLSFTGACGTVTLTPGDDILPAGHAMISYELSGGTLPADAPASYKMGETLKLPIPTLANAVFNGWYADAAMTQKITEIPATASGVFSVYASFTVHDVYVDCDYAQGASPLSLQKDGTAESTLKVDENGGYLLWTVQSGTNKLYKRSSPLISDLKDEEHALTYILTLAKEPGTGLIRSSFSLQVSESATGKNYGAANLLTTANDGSVYLAGQSDHKLCTLSDDGTPVTFRLVMDLDGAEDGTAALLTAYDESGTALAAVTMRVPSAAQSEISTMLEWSEWLTTYQVWWTAYGTGDGVNTAIRIHSIYGAAGDMITAP